MIEFDKIEKVAEYKNGELNWLEGRDINAVYVILVADEYYIGSSHYVYLRIQQHLKSLLYDNHHSDKLQNKFDEIKAFDVYVLERGIEKKSLLSREEYYIKKFNPTLNIKLPVKNTGSLRIKELIKERGYTQEQFAQMIGVTRVSLVKTLSGNPSYETLKRISIALDVPMWQLFASPEEVKAESDGDVCPYCGNLIKVNVKLEKKE